MTDAKVILLSDVFAERGIAHFRANETRVEVDTLYGPGPEKISMAEMRALVTRGLAEMRRLSSRRVEYRVTLTPSGRRLRDEDKRKAR